MAWYIWDMLNVICCLNIKKLIKLFLALGGDPVTSSVNKFLFRNKVNGNTDLILKLANIFFSLIDEPLSMISKDVGIV